MKYIEPEMEIIRLGEVRTTVVEASQIGNGGEKPVTPDVDLGW